MIAVEIDQSAYRIGASTTSFGPVGEWGPLPCGCCLVAEPFDPVGPRLLFVMMRRDASCKSHTLGEFGYGREHPPAIEDRTDWQEPPEDEERPELGRLFGV